MRRGSADNPGLHPDRSEGGPGTSRCAYGRAVHQVQAVAPAELRIGVSAWDRFRLGLLAVWLLLIVAAVTVGQRETPLSTLEAAVADGHVDSVVVLGEAVPAERGFGTQEVRWRDGLVRRTAQATVGARPDGGVVGLPWRGRDLGVLLSRADPDLEVRRSQQAYLMMQGRLLGWQVPVWVALTATAAFLLQFVLLIGVPRTSRATRWAWFWLMSVPVVGTALFLLLSGRKPGLRAPRATRRRLTGGWAFLLSSAAGALMSGATTSGGA